MKRTSHAKMVERLPNLLKIDGEKKNDKIFMYFFFFP